MKIICILALLIFLSPSIIFARGKFEAGLFAGSYQPSFRRFNEIFPSFNWKESTTQGFILGYQIIPKCNIRAQIDFFETKAWSSSYGTEIRLETTALSILAIFDLFQHQKYTIHSGVGLIDFGNFSCPGDNWGTVISVGLVAPIDESYQLSGEVQYVAGVDGELFGIPLDWDGFKFLVAIRIKF